MDVSVDMPEPARDVLIIFPIAMNDGIQYTSTLHALIHRVFNLSQRRFRVILAPLVHPQHILQSCTHCLHLRTSFPFVLLLVHPWTSLFSYFPYSTISSLALRAKI